MIFEFTSKTNSTFEAFHKFSIPFYSIGELFLFVGSVSESLVKFDWTKIYFGTVLLGTNLTETIQLVNNEHIPFRFQFDNFSFVAILNSTNTSFRPIISVPPTTGYVPPNGRISIELNFFPIGEHIYNYNLICYIKNKPTKLNSIDFESVYLNELKVIYITITNGGKFHFDYSFDQSNELQKIGINYSPKNEIELNKNEICNIEIRFNRTNRMVAFESALYVRFVGLVNKIATITGQPIEMDVFL